MSNYTKVVLASNAVYSSRWLTEEVFKLIDLVQQEEAIYNPRHKHYFCRPYVENFWRESDLKLQKHPGSSLAKWTNLRISFRREYSNYLEERLAPCWSYFDRMFFLRPFLRKKQNQPKGIEPHMQDALVHMKARMLREDAGIVLTQSNNATSAGNNGAPILDSYLHYYDEAEHNGFDLDDGSSEEVPESDLRFSTYDSAKNIKSECEDITEDYELHADQRNDNVLLQSTSTSENATKLEMSSSLASNSISSSDTVPTELAKTEQTTVKVKRKFRLYLQQQDNLYDNDNEEDAASVKRSRPEEDLNDANLAQQQEQLDLRVYSCNYPSNSNVSYVRPLCTKSSNRDSVDLLVSHVDNTSSVDSPTLSSASSSVATMIPAIAQRQHFESTALTLHCDEGSGSSSTGINTFAGLTRTSLTPQARPVPAASASMPTTATSSTYTELCDCKTDPDAMFLMSLLPDIRRLSGRGRGKIKLSFQKILQNALYPE